MLTRVKTVLSKDITKCIGRIATLRTKADALKAVNVSLKDQSSHDRKIENEIKKLNSLENRKQECIDAEIAIAFLRDQVKQLEEENRRVKRRLKKIVRIMES